jgi:3-isopropylmalate dehydratase small subunit
LTELSRGAIGNLRFDLLQTIKRSGLGYAAFAELRYHNADEVAKAGPDAAQLRDDFVLNQPGYDGGATTVLIAGDNFGCGSSREHAPWSILDLGIRCIVSTSFADIFFNNCFNNGMLPICLPREQVEALLEDAATPGTSLTIDLPRQVIVRPDGKGEFAFEVEPSRKENLLKGLDAIGLTLEQEATIAAFEAKRSVETPWLDGATSRVPDVVPMYPEAPSWQTA